jgi:hypothetical protein
MLPRNLVPHFVLMLLTIGAGVARLVSPPGYARVHLIVISVLFVALLVSMWHYKRAR